MQYVAIAAVVIIVLLALSLRVIQQYERGVVFRLGKLLAPRDSGLAFVFPVIDRLVKVSLRMEAVPVRVNAVVFFSVADAEKATVNVKNYTVVTSQKAQTTLRTVLGGVDLDGLLTEREVLNQRLQSIIGEQMEPIGIRVHGVEIKDVELPEGMQRAMARQAEAERERRAKVIAAEGEFQSAQQFANAAEILDRTKSGVQLRYLQTLTEIAAEHNSTTIFPVPIDLISNFLSGRGEH
ncbi:MAG: slipin family protein [Armatimonadetes bacterium]|nr:slipin family protein [Armatimonadota bacterium]